MSLTRTDVEDIVWLQSTIARELAVATAHRISNAEIDELERLNEQLAAAIATGDPDEVAQCEFLFHRTFNRASGRIKLAWFLLHTARYLPPRFFSGDQTWGSAAVTHHRELIVALRHRDLTAVVALTEAQFTDGLTLLPAWLDRVRLWD